MLLLQLFLNGVQTGMLYALIAAGFSLIFGMTRIFHAAHGATFVIAAYAFYHLYTLAEMSWVVAALGSAVAAVIFGAGFYLLVYRYIQRSEASFFTVFIAAFGAVVVVQNVVSMIYGRGFVVSQTELSRSTEVISGLYASSLVWVSILVALVFFFAMRTFLGRTNLGIAIRALADNPDLVRAFGMNPGRLSLYVFILGSVLVVPAAILTTISFGVSPAIGHHIVMISLAATIVGGIGSLSGAAIAGLLLGIAENVALYWVGSQWTEAVTFLILLLFIIVRPSGIFGRAIAS
ncbi:branched-chain amino acid ABC transporter permease [Rhodobacteraceae bacterium NNCM2]|nr:branched-chain amino acid ABC transporter permease [Coraliihabitans acroporae]